MPPKKTFSRLTFGSSVSVGVYMGSNTTSWPRAINSAASALSRRQVPQYMLAAPAVMDRILISIEFSSSNGDGALEGAARVQVLEQISLVRLVPVDAGRRHGPQVQPAHVRG